MATTACSNLCDETTNDSTYGNLLYHWSLFNIKMGF